MTGGPKEAFGFRVWGTAGLGTSGQRSATSPEAHDKMTCNDHYIPNINPKPDSALYNCWVPPGELDVQPLSED